MILSKTKSIIAPKLGGFPPENMLRGLQGSSAASHNALLGRVVRCQAHTLQCTVSARLKKDSTS